MYVCMWTDGYEGIKQLGTLIAFSFQKYNLTDILPCYDMVQGHFIVGAAHESKLVRCRCKNSWLRRHSPFGARQAPSDELSHARRQKPGRTAPWGQVQFEKYNHSVWMPGVLPRSRQDTEFLESTCLKEEVGWNDPWSKKEYSFLF